MAGFKSRALKSRTLATMPLAQRLGLTASWLPPGHPQRQALHERTPWQDWRDYVEAAQAVEADLRQRDEQIAPWPGPQSGIRDIRVHRYGYRGLSFGRRVLAYVAQHGLDALETATPADLAAVPDPMLERLTADYQRWKQRGKD